MRMTIVVAILLCTLGARADPRGRRVQQVQQLASRAAHELSLGKPARAQKQLRAALARYPGETALLAPYAELLLPLVGEPVAAPTLEAARELLRQVERARAVSGAVLVTADAEAERSIALHAALAEGALGHYEQAFAQLVDAGHLQDVPTVTALRKLALLALHDEQLLVAEQALGLARQYMPQDPELPRELGRVLLARGKSEVALQVLAERFAIASGSLGARIDLAYAMAASGRPGEGLSLLTGVRIECERERSCALVGARVALESARPEQAIALVTALAETHDLDALFVLADAQLRAGDAGAARRAYEQVLQLRPDSVRARQGLEQLPAR